MAEVALVVDCRTAHVPRHLARLDGDKGHRSAGLERVVYFDRLHGGGSEGESAGEEAILGGSNCRSGSSEEAREIHSERSKGIKRKERSRRQTHHPRVTSGLEVESMAVARRG